MPQNEEDLVLEIFDKVVEREGESWKAIAAIVVPARPLNGPVVSAHTPAEIKARELKIASVASYLSRLNSARKKKRSAHRANRNMAGLLSLNYSRITLSGASVDDVERLAPDPSEIKKYIADTKLIKRDLAAAEEQRRQDEQTIKILLEKIEALKADLEACRRALPSSGIGS